MLIPNALCPQLSFYVYKVVKFKNWIFGLIFTLWKNLEHSARIFGKKIRESGESNGFTVLNKLLKSWFDEIFNWWERISRFSTLCTVEFTKFLNHDFLKNYRENNFFSKEFTKELISRNYFQVIKNLANSTVCTAHSENYGNLQTLLSVRVNFYFHTTLGCALYIWQKFR